MLRKGLFITGTDTGVGKTFVSALVMSALKKSGIFSQFHYFKPVQTGTELDEDTETVMERAELKITQIVPPAYRFEAPLSPDRAAALEGERVDMDQILKVFQAQGDSFWVVEGAGGLEVPLNESEKISDLIQNANLPVLLVASTKLGTINHTLLSLRRLKALGNPLVGVVLVGEKDEGLTEVLEREGVNILSEIPWVEDVEASWDQLTFQLAETLLPRLNQATIREHSTLDDQEFIWHPYTQHGLAQEFPMVTRAKGSWLYLEDGQKLLDGVSSWWLTLHGHAQPEVAEAIAAQAQRLEQVIFAGYTHEPAVQLAKNVLSLVQDSNPQLKKVFFSDNGSTAVEVAMKMAYQAQMQKGQTQRKKFLALKGSYHGDTLAAMSASEREGFHKVFTPLMAPVDFLEPDNFEELEILATELSQYSACIVEPLVQGAGGMRFYSPEYLLRLSEVCRDQGVYLIADEVFTGIQRMGTFLASEQALVQPDLVCLSKGLTGGFLPLSLTLATQEIFSAFESADLEKAFLHGHSFTANPIACAAANASLELLKTEKVQTHLKKIEQMNQVFVEKLKTFGEVIQKPRTLGTLVAFEVQGHEGYFSGNFGRTFAKLCREQEVLLRTLGGTVYVLPPYGTSEQELTKIFNVIETSLKRMEIL